MESKDFQDKNKTNAVSKISPKLAGHHILVYLWQLTFWDTDTTTYTAKVGPQLIVSQKIRKCHIMFTSLVFRLYTKYNEDCIPLLCF